MVIVIKANMLGQAAGDIAQLFIGTGEAKVASEAGTIAKASSTVEKSVLLGGDASRIENAATRINKPHCCRK